MCIFDGWDRWGVESKEYRAKGWPLRHARCYLRKRRAGIPNLHLYHVMMFQLFLWIYPSCYFTRLLDIVKDAKQDSFAEKLVTNVIKNLEVKITNIHVRYEDNYTNPQKPFSIGVTLKELSCQVCPGTMRLVFFRCAGYSRKELKKSLKQL